jgi:hypothetical protein
VESPQSSQTKAAQVIERYNALKAERSTWESHWQEVADYVLPRKDQILRQTTEGQKKAIEKYDSTAVHSNELLAGALHGLLTNPASLWFDLKTGDPTLDRDDNIRRWMQDVRNRMHLVLNNSNFQTEIHEVYIDEGSFGTAGLFMEEDDEKIIRFSARTVGDFVVDENHLGIIDTVIRSFKWSARQIVQMFGYQDMPREIQSAYDRNSNDKWEILHMISPRSDEQRQGKEGPKGYPILSVHVLKDREVVLSEGGFREQPFSIPRWTKSAGEKYGRSPAMKALADIKMINAMMKTHLKAAQKAVDPPLLIDDDGVVLPVKTTPGGLNFRRRGGQGDGIKAFGHEGRFEIGYQVMEDTRKRIREAFYIDQLQLGVGPQMTATEVRQRTEEKMRLLGPVLGRQHNELLRPLIDRLFGIMLRRELLPPPPEALAGKNIDVEYSSLIAKAQRMAEGENLSRVVALIAPFAQTDPTVMDNIDGDEVVRFVGDVYGLPNEVLRKRDEVEEMRQARAELQQQQMQQQQQSQQIQDAATGAQAAASMMGMM